MKKFITKASILDGPVTILDDDSVAAHEDMWKRAGLSTEQLQANLRALPAHSLRNLAVRQRNRLAGTHQEPEVNQESRPVTLETVSRLAAARLIVANANPRLSRTSAKFNELVALTLKTPEEQEAYFANLNPR
jgi:hypothetical protein